MEQPQKEKRQPVEAEEEEEEEVVALQRKQHPPERKSSTDSDEDVDIEEEIYEKDDDYDVVGVLTKQRTYDLICPNCSSCITRQVILRRKPRKIRPEAPEYEFGFDDDIVIGDVVEYIGKTPTEKIPPKVPKYESKFPGSNEAGDVDYIGKTPTENYIRPEVPKYEPKFPGGIGAGDGSTGATPTTYPAALAPEEPRKDQEGKLEPEPEPKPELAIKCFSCFSLFIPTGKGFWILQGNKKDESITSEEPEEVAAEGANLWNFFNICAPDEKTKPATEKVKSDAGEKLKLSVEPKPGPIKPPSEVGEKPETSVKPKPEETPVDTGDKLEITVESGGLVLETVSEPPMTVADETRGLDILRSVVYGGLIESITSLGVVSSAAGGGASTVNIVALALANLVSGLFVIVHNVIQLKNSDRTYNYQQDQYEELLGRRENYPLHFTICILSYFIFGLIPPLVYGFSFYQSTNTYFNYVAVAAASFVCIVSLAVGKAYIGRPPKTYFKTLLYYASAGVAAAEVSYFIGEGLEELFEKLSLFEPSSAFDVNLLVAKPMWASF